MFLYIQPVDLCSLVLEDVLEEALVTYIGIYRLAARQ
jgi:hypothetical protein